MASQRRWPIIVFTCCVSFLFVAGQSDATVSPVIIWDDEEILPSSDGSTQEGKIRLALCCPQGFLYKTGLDSCSVLTSNKSAFPSLVYSVETNQTIAVKVTDDIFSVSNFILGHCPDGFVSDSTSDFLFYDDGSLRIDHQRRRLKSDEFCLNQVDDSDGLSSTTDPTVWIARFCVPDPCANGPCIRKCCPFGQALHSRPERLGALCLPYSTPFDASLLTYQQGNSPVNPLAIHGGHGLKCYVDGQLAVNLIHEPGFVFLADGRMYNAEYPSTPIDSRTTSDYCVDQFSDYTSPNNETILIGLRCYVTPSTHPPGLDIFPYTLVVSSVFAIATFAVYAILPEMRNIHGVILMCYLASMSVMYIGLAIIQLYSLDFTDEICYTFPVLVHFAFMATFSWLNVVCFDVWRTFGWKAQVTDNRLNQNKLGRPFLFYSIYGWGYPLVFVLTGQILQHVGDLSSHTITPDFGLQSCWFFLPDRQPLIIYLYGPLLVSIFLNVVMFIWTAVAFFSSSVQVSQITTVARKTQRFRVILSLFLLMGVLWITEIVDFFLDGLFAHWVFLDILNLLTGVYIFVIFVCKPKVWKMLKSRFAPCLATSAATCQRIPCLVRHKSQEEFTTRLPHSQSDDNRKMSSVTNETSLSL